MKKVAALAGLVAVIAVARRYLQKLMVDIPAELRSPLVPIFSVPFNRWTLPFIRMVYSLRSTPGPHVLVKEHRVGDDSAVCVLVTTPAEPASGRPAVLWIHSGGMCVGSPQFETYAAGHLARELGAVVVAPDYRLAPENPFPAGLDDCMKALRWMRGCAGELGIDPHRIAVGGRSAGGGLAAAVAQRSCDERISLRAQVLVYPMLDDRTTFSTDHGRRGKVLWSPKSNRFAWTAYLGREPRMLDAPEYAAPARREDVAGLAPAWIGIGDADLFYDECVGYAGTLQNCGVPCELVIVPRMYHAADELAPKATSLQPFRDGIVNHLRTYLTKTP